MSEKLSIKKLKSNQALLNLFSTRVLYCQRDKSNGQNLILKVYYKNDMDVYLKYAIETYGIDFWKLLTDEEK